jgi:hypothetical protein
VTACDHWSNENDTEQGQYLDHFAPVGVRSPDEAPKTWFDGDILGYT